MMEDIDRVWRDQLTDFLKNKSTDAKGIKIIAKLCSDQKTIITVQGHNAKKIEIPIRASIWLCIMSSV